MNDKQLRTMQRVLALLPETDAGGASIFAQRLRSEMRDDEFFKDNRATFSGGISCYPENGKEVVDLVEAAD